MLGLLRRAHAYRAGPRGRVVLRLNCLEERDQPSDAGPGDFRLLASPTMYGDEPPSVNQPPSITEFSCIQVGGGLFRISGRVIDESPGGLTVILGGPTSAAGLATTTLPDGSFTMLVQLKTDGSDIGTIKATTTDAQGLQSNEVSEYVYPTP
ncbi:MAG TPA: hypothetical protein VKD90_16135 [Gemmataceae bacterium]|nr:hypothetical protein [Gemmataceae bacterium]